MQLLLITVRTCRARMEGCAPTRLRVTCAHATPKSGEGRTAQLVCMTCTSTSFFTLAHHLWSTEVFEFTIVTIEEQPEPSSFPTFFSRVTLTCGAEGIPEPNITWYKDDVLLPGENSKTLVILEVQLSDRGRYHCNATNFDPNKQTDNKFEDVSIEAVINIQGGRLNK